MTRQHRPVTPLAPLLAAALALCAAAAPLAAQTVKPQRAAAQSAPAKADKGAPPAKGEQSIAVLVNDEPVTGYEIDQRATFLAVSSGGGGGDMKAKAEARWAQIAKDPRTNERLQQLLREKNPKTREEAQAIQTQYVRALQHDMIEQLRRESRTASLPRFRKEAQEELIDERLKLQEAKKLGIEATDDDANRILHTIAERNKMTDQQFTQHLKSMGVDITTMRERLRAQHAWREVIRRKYASQISVAQRDIDRLVSAAATEAGEDTVELQLQRVTLPLPASIDQTTMARRYAEAEALARKAQGCKNMANAAKEVGDARFEDLKYVKPAGIPEPTRSLLFAAKDGDVLPPAAAATGIEVYAVCARRAIKTDEKQREKAIDELQQREIEIVAKRHLRNLRQDAHIEYR